MLSLQRIVHRDIKLDNILYDKPTNRVRIIDWGCAGPYHTPTFCGTPGYWPHECFRIVGQDEAGEETYALSQPQCKRMRKCYNSRYDVWCMAMAMLKLWGVQLPEQLGRYKYDNWRQWTAQDWAALLAKEIPDAPEVQHFLCVALNPTPELRSKASQLLHHPLIKALVAQVGACC